ncbi:hypothetical protein CONLIGDRAFT_648954 [Coniochaeta ligniaria NRRL 30616]|uniref:DUF1748-domain-containing protein n=1 Tax=Coniochaeta ligniaria NRRL 30616 TaxID=1408157 RepID=A0A1J7IST8_9PEZI|nr:hypothetical protein CONLIGDRAFT_648954 [Coniochaeta ligniaria NRRL 30616]
MSVALLAVMEILIEIAPSAMSSKLQPSVERCIDAPQASDLGPDRHSLLWTARSNNAIHLTIDVVLLSIVGWSWVDDQASVARLKGCRLVEPGDQTFAGWIVSLLD